MVDTFYDTFGADVIVSFGQERTNKYGITYKSAVIEVTNSSRDLNQFISEIHKHGSNQFNHTKTDTWKVQFKSEPTPVLIRTPPRIIF